MVSQGALPTLAVAALAVLAAGCTTASESSADHASPGVATLSENTSTPALGERTSSTSCPDGRGDLTFSVSGSAGAVRFLVTDESGREVASSGPESGMASNTQYNVPGSPGTWTLHAERTDFAGSYSAVLTC